MREMMREHICGTDTYIFSDENVDMMHVRSLLSWTKFYYSRTFLARYVLLIPFIERHVSIVGIINSFSGHKNSTGFIKNK